MIQQFREFTKTTAMKLLLGLLILTFVLWGFGSMFRTPNNNRYVAKIGKERILEKEWYNTLSKQILMRERLLGRKMTTEEINDPYLRKSILDMLINNRLLKIENEELELFIGDEVIKKALASNPLFHNELGRFDPEKFRQYAINSGKNESQALQDVVKSLQFEFITQALSDTFIYPGNIGEILLKAQGVNHIMDLYTLKHSDVDLDLKASDAELSQLLHENIDEFTKPEVRLVSHIKFSESDIELSEEITEDMVEEYYNQNMLAFMSAERRYVYQAILNSYEEAEAFFNEIIAKDDPKARLDLFIANAKNIMEDDDYILGYVEDDSLLPQVSQQIFSTERYSMTEIVPTPLGFHIFIIAEIEESKPFAYKDVKSQVKKAIEEDYKAEGLNQLAQQIDNDIIAGVTLEDIADNYGLSLLQDTYEMDQLLVENQTENTDRLFKVKAKSLEEGETSIVYHDKASDNYYVVRVDEIEGSRLYSVDEMRADLESIWYNDMIAEKVNKIFTQLAELIQEDIVLPIGSGESNSSQAASQNLSNFLSQNKIKQTKAVKLSFEKGLVDSKGLDNKIFENALLDSYLSLAVGDTSDTFYSNDTRSFILGYKKDLEVLDEKIVDSDKAAKQQQVANLIKQGNREIMLEQLITSLRNKHNVTINEQILYQPVQ